MGELEDFKEITGGIHMILFLLGLTTGLVISLASLIIIALNYKTRGRDDEDDE